MFRLTEFLMNLTEPSAIAKFTPPGWKLRNAHCPSELQGPPGIAALLSQSGGKLQLLKQALRMLPVVSAGVFGGARTKAPPVIR